MIWLISSYPADPPGDINIEFCLSNLEKAPPQELHHPDFMEVLWRRKACINPRGREGYGSQGYTICGGMLAAAEAGKAYIVLSKQVTPA
jgi:hypothetical protein